MNGIKNMAYTMETHYIVKQYRKHLDVILEVCGFPD